MVIIRNQIYIFQITSLFVEPIFKVSCICIHMYVRMHKNKTYVQCKWWWWWRCFVMFYGSNLLEFFWVVGYQQSEVQYETHCWYGSVIIIFFFFLLQKMHTCCAARANGLGGNTSGSFQVAFFITVLLFKILFFLFFSVSLHIFYLFVFLLQIWTHLHYSDYIV